MSDQASDRAKDQIPDESSSQTSSQDDDLIIEARAKDRVSENPPLDRHECKSWGYIYEPTKGDSTGRIPAMTRFEDLPASWRCPVCGVKAIQFKNIGESGKASGFTENLNYGLGVNRLTPGQKNLLIFGLLALGIVFFLSLYGLH